MPEMGGMEATKLVRSLELKQPIIVALTADVFVSKDSGFDDVILKPINKEQLGALIKKYSSA